MDDKISGSLPFDTPSSAAFTSLLSRWETVFLFFVGVLSSTILLKIGQVQYLEILYVLQIAVLLTVFILRGYTATWFRPFLRLGVLYTFFCITAIALAFAALRFQFYLPPFVNPFKKPIVITLLRVIELVASVSIMLYMADLFRRAPAKARFTMRVYFWTGVASAIYSLLSYPINAAGLGSLGSYSSANRLRGFYNEGGPYGLYLLSLFFVGVALYKLGWEPRRRIHLLFVLLAVVLVMASSKAAILAALILFILNILFASNAGSRALLLVVTLAFFTYSSQKVDIVALVRAYQRGNAAFERLSHLHPKDPNFIYGRVAGGFIVPRMIAAHPLTGVGWGNYGILRNAPEYRGAAAWAEGNDDPGLGLFGDAAEFGLPLITFAIACLLVPFFYLRRLRAPAYLINLALLQPVVHLCGAQLNLTYPWVVTSFALGLAYSQAKSRQAQPIPRPYTGLSPAAATHG